MSQLESLIRFGYALLIVSMVLMIWASLAGARDLEIQKYPPCIFIPFCTCSKSLPDLGVVQCRAVPYPAIPKLVNHSKVFMLHMERTGLRKLDPQFFETTGLYRLEISYNPLSDIPDDAFFGLERSLWELLLHHNELVEIPSRAIRHLKKLRTLDLSGNQINCIEAESFRGLGDSLQILKLAHNSIGTLPPDCFASLPNIETIDLSGNNLAQINPNVFRDGMPRLAKLVLADNVFADIPYQSLSSLKSLRVLDLSHNNIKSILPDGSLFYEPNTSPKLTLDTIHLEFNRIHDIPSGSFANFDSVNVTYLDGNPLVSLGDEAFRSTRMRELYIRYCGLTYISSAAFEGMGNALQILDLTGNNITVLPEFFLRDFDDFRTLSLKDNKLKTFQPIEMFNAFQFTIEKFDISGEQNAIIDLQSLRKMRNIRSLALGRLMSTKLGPEDFVELGVELEDLKITHTGLQTIKAHAFKNVRAIRRLDLSENQISQIESEAFAEIGHSLKSLKISHGLAPSINAFPTQSFRLLTSLRELDLSNNHIKSISDTSFHFLHNLQVLELNDNNIDQILKGTFQGDIHTRLEFIALNFNRLKQIQHHSFADLKALSQLQLDDNLITNIERRAFMNLNQLRFLTLRGNKLDTISDEAFQIYKDDPLPQRICKECEQNVNQFYERVQRYHLLERCWRSQVQATNPSDPYLRVYDANKDQSGTIETKLNKLLSHKDVTNNESTLYSIKENVDIKSFAMVPSLKRLCLDTLQRQQQRSEALANPTVKTDVNKNIQSSYKSRLRKGLVGYVKPRRLMRRTRTGRLVNALSTNASFPTTNRSVKSENPKKITSSFVMMTSRRRRPKDFDFLSLSENDILENRTRTSRRSAQPFSYNEKRNRSTITPDRHAVCTSQPRTVRTIEPLRIKTEKDKEQKVKAVQPLSPANASTSNEEKTEIALKVPQKTNKNLAKKSSSQKNTLLNHFSRVQTPLSPTRTSQPRVKPRINYSEDLVDEALLYEEMLLNTQREEQRMFNRTIESSRQPSMTAINGIKIEPNLDSRLRLLEENDEITIVPLNKPKPTILPQTQKKPQQQQQQPSFAKLISEPMSSLPSNVKSIFNINSAVSVHMKPKATTSVPSTGLQITKIHSLHGAVESKPAAQKKIACKYCSESFDNVKLLAIHQATHLNVSVFKLGSKNILQKKYRRGTVLTVNNCKYYQCSNCFLQFRSNVRIIDHWNSGKCMHYCKICGQTFHNNIKDIREHFIKTHGVRYGPIPLSADENVTNATRLLYDEQMRRILTDLNGQRRARLSSSGTSFNAISSKSDPLPLKPEPVPVKTTSTVSKPNASVSSKSNIIGATPTTPAPNEPAKRDNVAVKCKVCGEMFKNRKALGPHARIHKNGMRHAKMKIPPRRHSVQVSIPRTSPINSLHKNRNEYADNVSESPFKVPIVPPIKKEKLDAGYSCDAELQETEISCSAQSDSPMLSTNTNSNLNGNVPRLHVKNISDLQEPTFVAKRRRLSLDSRFSAPLNLPHKYQKILPKPSPMQAVHPFTQNTQSFMPSYSSVVSGARIPPTEQEVTLQMTSSGVHPVQHYSTMFMPAAASSTLSMPFNIQGYDSYN